MLEELTAFDEVNVSIQSVTPEDGEENGDEEATVEDETEDNSDYRHAA